MKPNPITEALFVLLHSFGNMLLGRGISAGWPIQVGRKPTSCLPLWALTVLPAWFFCFVTLVHAVFDILSLVPTANVKGQNEIFSILGCSLTAFVFGLYAAQLSVAVTPGRFLRPLMSLWILVLPYMLARQLSHLLADWIGLLFSLVPGRLTNENGIYLSIAILSAIIYSFVIRREPSKSPQPKTRNASPTAVPHD